MKHGDWTHGAGTFIGYTFAVVGLCSFIILLLGFFQLARTMNRLEHAADVISRDIVVCESLSDAQTLAQEEFEQGMKGYTSVIKAGRLKAEVVFSPGSPKEWKKGNYITLLLTADIDSRLPMASGEKTVTAMVMIEKDGGGD